MVDSIVVSLNFREIENHIAHTNDTLDMTYTICIFIVLKYLDLLMNQYTYQCETCG